VYDRGADDVGVAPADIDLGPLNRAAAGLTFRLSRVDTTAPFPTSVQLFDRHHLLAKFSEPIDSASVASAVIAVDDTVNHVRLAVALAYHERGARQALGVLLADTLRAGRVYLFRAIGVRDARGNTSDSGSAAVEFFGTDRPDTLAPTFTVSGVADTARGVAQVRSFEVRFSEPVLPSAADAAIRLVDSLGRDVITRRAWVGGKDLEIIPRDPLRPAEIYRLTVRLDSLEDRHRNTGRDSIATVRIRTLDVRSTGLITGVIQDGARFGRPGPVEVTASSVGLSPPVVQRTWTSGSSFALRLLPEGRYVLSAFVDADSSGVYTYGQAFPFKPGERFTVVQDTLRVRARWSVEGVAVRFP
jgi:hypothetical protein